MFQRYVAETTTFVNPAQYQNLYQNSIPLMQELIKVSKLIANTSDTFGDIVFGQDNPRDKTPPFHHFRNILIPRFPGFVDDIWWKDGLQKEIIEATGWEELQ